MLRNYIIYYYLRYLKRINTPKAIIKYAIKLHGNKIILVDKGIEISFITLNEKVNRVCAALHASGIKKNDRIGVWMYNRHEFIEIRLACYKCGFVFCALIDDFSFSQAKETLNDTECLVLFFDQRLNAENLDDLTENTKIKYFVHLDKNLNYYKSVSYNSFIADMPVNEPDAIINPFEISAIGFTSGTTGKSKGIVWTHRAWLYSFYHFLLNNRESGKKDKIFLHVLPFSTAGSLIILPALLSGARNIILTSFNQAEVAEVIDREKVTHLALSPSFLIELWDFYISNRNKFSFTSLQSISVGSAILYSKKWEEMIDTFGPIIQQSYGMAEVLAPLAFLKLSRPIKNKELLKSVGKPIPQIKIRIDEKGTDSIGAISIKSRTCAINYLNNNEISGKKFYRNWFKTDDKGYFDNYGNLFIVDRAANIFEINGEKVVSREMEEVIHEFPGIKEVCVVCKDNEIIVYASERQNHNINIGDLENFCKERFSKNANPSKFLIMEFLPHSTSGKVLKNML